MAVAQGKKIMTSFTRLALVTLAASFTACSFGDERPNGPRMNGGAGTSGQAGTGGDPAPTGAAATGPQVGNAGVVVTIAQSEAQTSALVALKEKVAPAKAVTAETLATARAVPFAPSLGYDPMAAKNLALVQGSHLKLDDAELALLTKNGFVISEKKRYPGFVYAYETIYADDLPVFVSADSIMHAVHRSYDDILRTVELERLAPELDALLSAMHARLAQKKDGFSPTATADADLFLAVARGLLAGTTPGLVAGGDAALTKSLVQRANAATGADDIQLFGLKNHYDFSQFTPRGHYAGTQDLERYFRAMIWLGRTELPIIYVDPETGEARFVRRQLDLAVALRRLMDVTALGRWTLIDSAIRAFVGEPDSMSPPQVDTLFADLGVTDLAGLAALPDQQIAQKIVDGGYGKQAISSQAIINNTNGTLPLSTVWLFLGQRYVVDSHVFSNVVFDRVLHDDKPQRLMPNPLDVAYAALRNDQAISLLSADLTKYGYAPELETTRALVDEHGTAFWHANLYNEWLGALRALSPTADVGDATSGLPSVARGAAWGRRVLNTQLASWAELRRDTILYAKQSYTGGNTCEFPDAYVDPYPAFFAALESFAQKGAALATTLSAGSTSTRAADIGTYFQHLGDVSGILREMAEHQRTGTPHAARHLAFINDIVKIQRYCGGASATGWYPKLFFSPGKATQFDPTIADVHTQPFAEGGAEVGKVLHVATGQPRAMVVTIDTCEGPRAYAGVVSAYHEKITDHYKRLDDQAWSEDIAKALPADVPWMNELVAH
jgi:hypothetical protein